MKKSSRFQTKKYDTVLEIWDGTPEEIGHEANKLLTIHMSLVPKLIATLQNELKK